MKINPIGHLVKTNPIQTQSKPILERMNVNFCAAGYYESKPTFAVRKGRPNNPNAEINTALRKYRFNEKTGLKEILKTV
jgi:hypothetical protein